MHNVTLKKITGGTAVRTDVTVGRCHKLPVVGESFEMFSEPLVSGANVRWITTSAIQKITPEENSILIETRNSVYRLDFEQT